MDDVLSLMVIEAIYNKPTEIPIRLSWLRLHIINNTPIVTKRRKTIHMHSNKSNTSNVSY